MHASVGELESLMDAVQSCVVVIVSIWYGVGLLCLLVHLWQDVCLVDDLLEDLLDDLLLSDSVSDVVGSLYAESVLSVWFDVLLS